MLKEKCEMPISHFLKIGNIKDCIFGEFSEIIHRLEKNHSYDKAEKGDDSSDEDIFDYAKPVNNEVKEDDPIYTNFENKTYLAADKAIDAYNGIMKVFLPPASTKNFTPLRSPTKLAMALKNCRRHFETVLNSPNLRTADTELYVVFYNHSNS